jgi:hypothetical protein
MKTFSKAMFLCAGLVSAFFCVALNAKPLDALAQDFIDLGLRFQNYDKSQFLFLGDPLRASKAKMDPATLTDVLDSLDVLIEELEQSERFAKTETEKSRAQALLGRTLAMHTRGRILQGDALDSFDRESYLTFGVQVPKLSEAHFEALAAKLEQVVPGDGALVERMERFRDQFVIPVDRLEAVLGAAMSECRKRTKAVFDLPINEGTRFTIVDEAPWVGFTHFEGNAQSNILLNRSVPIHIERALELGCHEGYPGHHAHASMLEQNVILERGWKEYELIQLLGPMAVVNEGAASYAVELAFSRNDRLSFERDILLPLAGLSADNLETYYHFIDLINDLSWARTEAARRYLYEGYSRERTIHWLMEFGLETRGTATQKMNLIEAQRAYILTYNHGYKLVSEYIERHADSEVARWALFIDILLKPMLPGDLEL